MSLMLTGAGRSGLAGAADEIQVVTFSPTPTGGTWAATFDGQTAAGLAWDVTAAALQAALEALSTIGGGNVRVDGSVSDGFRVTFRGALAGTPVSEMTADGSGLTQPATGTLVETLAAGDESTLASWRITLTGAPTGGTFFVATGFDSGTRDWDASAAEVESVWTSPPVDVTGPDGGPWVVTVEAGNEGFFPAPTADGANLTRGGITAAVLTARQGG